MRRIHSANFHEMHVKLILFAKTINILYSKNHDIMPVQPRMHLGDRLARQGHFLCTDIRTARGKHDERVWHY